MSDNETELRADLWDAINRYTTICGGDTGQATVGGMRMDAVVKVQRAIDAVVLASNAELIASLEAGVKGKNGIYPDWVYSARDAIQHRDRNIPWLPDLLDALGWKGGTIHDALSCVRRLVDAADQDEERQRVGTLLTQMRKYIIFHGLLIGECVAWNKLKEMFGVGQE